MRFTVQWQVIILHNKIKIKIKSTRAFVRVFLYKSRLLQFKLEAKIKTKSCQFSACFLSRIQDEYK